LTQAIVPLASAIEGSSFDTINDLDNVLYEIANEAATVSIPWQYELIDYIHAYEAGKPKQHPVGMSATNYAGHVILTADLLASNADFICPPGWDSNNWQYDPPAATGNRVHILDVDHIFPGQWDAGAIDHGQWIWKAFLRGHSAIHMDDCANLGIAGVNPYTPLRVYDVFRTTQRQTADYAARCNLNRTIPNGALSSTGYCIANPGHQYLVLRPGSTGSFAVDLSAGSGKTFAVEWLNVADSSVQITLTSASRCASPA
jgi:hypothetical protein